MMAGDTVRGHLGEIDDEAFERLRSVIVDCGYDFRPNLAELITSWSTQVRRLHEEVFAEVEPRDPRTEHDFVGSLYARDRLQKGLELAAEDTRLVAWKIVQRADDLFSETTAPDIEGFVSMVDLEPIDGRGWWWRRAPVNGPARAGMEAIAENLASGR